jgi:hypothetical protein
VTTLDELRDWLDSVRARSLRMFESRSSIPAGWHVLQADGDFGFLDVELPTRAEEHARLVTRIRDALRELQVRACLFVAERELSDGRPVLFLQEEAIDARAQRHRAVVLYRIAARDDGRIVDASSPVEPREAADRALARDGIFPDLLAEPPSLFRFL